jgi:hypothetical protein
VTPITPDMASLPPLPAVPVVSIYCTAYNHERFVAEAVESVLAQDWPADRLQFVVVEDGSTDGTLEALQPYRDEVRIIHQENRGVRGAVNRGMAELTGDVITSISGDDVWVPGRIRRLVETLQEHPRAGLVHSDLEVIDGDGALLSPSFRDVTGIAAIQGPLSDSLLKHNVVCGASVMQRACLKHLVHPIPDHAPWEDYWWAWTLARAADVVYLPEITCRYRMHGNNLSFGAGPEKVAEAMHEERTLRRAMLQSLQPGDVQAQAAVDGLRAFRTACAAGPGKAEVAAGRLTVAVSDADRRQAALRAAAGRDALAAGDVSGAVVHGVAGLADDPSHTALNAWLLDLVRGWEGSLPVEPELRRVVVLADADELVARPELLPAYVARVTDADDVTLVVHGAGWTDHALMDAFAGPLETTDADVLATGDEPLGRAALIARADLALGAAVAGGLPTCGADDVAEVLDAVVAAASPLRPSPAPVPA